MTNKYLEKVAAKLKGRHPNQNKGRIPYQEPRMKTNLAIKKFSLDNTKAQRTAIKHVNQLTNFTGVYGIPKNKRHKISHLAKAMEKLVKTKTTHPALREMYRHGLVYLKHIAKGSRR